MDWIEGRAINLSSPTQKRALEGMDEMVEIGEIIVPLILRRLEEKTSLIAFILLADITDVDLKKEGYLKKKNFGRTEKVRKAWLKWGRDNKLI